MQQDNGGTLRGGPVPLRGAIRLSAAATLHAICEVGQAVCVAGLEACPRQHALVLRSGWRHEDSVAVNVVMISQSDAWTCFHVLF